jgi:arylsulfatase A-like enzyme
MKRRDFIRTAGSAALSLSLPGCGAALGPAFDLGRRRRPNIVFIMADDLGYGDLGCYGQKYTLTGRIDRMAAEGTRFTRCYAGHCVCAPSRSVLMTGQHTGHTRVRENKCRFGGVPDEETGGGCRPPLLLEDVTVAEVLKEAGYATGITGKWGLGDPGTVGVPNLQGFDEFFGYLNQNHAVYYYTDYLWRNDQRIPIDANANGKRGKYTHDLFTAFALDFIRRHREHPFFLYVPYTIPHFNMEVPDTADYDDRPWPKEAKIFAAMVSRMDRDVGRILDLLKELGLDRDTIVFFTSDNGQAGNGGPMFESGGGLAGSKGGFHEGGIRVPMVVRWPGMVPAGRVSGARWYFADVLPTLARVAGARRPRNVDGVSVLPSLLGRRQNLDDRFMYWESPPPKLTQVVIWRNFKAWRTGSGAIRLYDLSNDPGEKNDIAGKRPDVVKVFENYLKNARTESPYYDA